MPKIYFPKDIAMVEIAVLEFNHGQAITQALNRKNLMTKFSYKFCDDTEKDSGVIFAGDMVMAAIHALTLNGRYKRHSVKEKYLAALRGAEVAEIDGFECNAFTLSLKMIGSRKRKPLRIHA